MIGFASPMFGKGDGAPPPPVGPLDPATLFTGGILGAYYDFTDGTSLAVNADGTGGVPAIGAACRSALDKSPNSNRLRNTVSSVIRRSNGIETDGANYGLFNFAGFGNWPNIVQPVEIVASMELLATETVDERIIGSGGISLLAGTAGGKLRGFAGAYGTEFSPGLATEFVIDLLFDPLDPLAGINTGTPSASASPGNNSLSSLCLGSDTGGNSATRVRFKHLLVIARALTASERAGVVQWMQA